MNLSYSKINAYIVQDPINRLYLTGFDSSFGILVLSENSKTFYTDPRYFLAAKENLTGFSVKSVKAALALEEVAKDLAAAGLKTIGYEDKFLTVAAFKGFKDKLKVFSLKPASSFIDTLRLVKTDEEVAKIKQAQALAEKAFEKLVDWLKPGVTEKEVATQLNIECLKLGADDMAFKSIIAFGENSAIPHHSPTDKKLEKNDLILVDFGVKLNGYNSDMTRTFCIGTPSPKMAEIYEIVLEAQKYALKNIKAGLTATEADSFSREYIKAHGFGEQFSHSLGHGIGLLVHESPFLREKNDDILLPGMVVTIEPGIYLENEGGVRIEDMAVIREDGVENLTSTGKKLSL